MQEGQSTDSKGNTNSSKMHTKEKTPGHIRVKPVKSKHKEETLKASRREKTNKQWRQQKPDNLQRHSNYTCNKFLNQNPEKSEDPEITPLKFWKKITSNWEFQEI